MPEIDLRNGAIIFGILATIGMIAIPGVSWYHVDVGYTAVEFNQITLSLEEKGPGLHFKLPLLETRQIYETRSQIYRDHVEGASLDLQIVTAEVAVLYRPFSGATVSLHTEFGPSYAERVLKPAIYEVVKATTASHNATDLIERRALVKDEITFALREELSMRLVMVDEVSITDFDFSPEFNAAIESKVVALQEAQRAENNLTRTKYEAEASVLWAEAQLRSARLNATAVAIMQEQLGGRGEYLDWMRLVKWDGVLPRTLVTGNETSASVLVGLP